MLYKNPLRIKLGKFMIQPFNMIFIFLIISLYLPLSLYASKLSSENTIEDLTQSPEVQNFIRKIQFHDSEVATQNSSPLYFTSGSNDQKDYIRLINIKRLLDERRAEIEKVYKCKNQVPFERRLAFLTDLSRQVDGLSVQEGYIRYLSTPKGSRQAFWKRLTYMYHGLCLNDLSQTLKKYIVNTIWEGNGEQQEVYDCIPLTLVALTLKEPSISEPLYQIQEIIDILDYRKFELELNAFQELESLISSLLKIEVERHFYEQMTREWPWRLDELASEYWFSPRPLHATIALNQPDWNNPDSPKMQINEIYKNFSLTGDQKFDRAMKIVQAKAEGVKSSRIVSLCKIIKDSMPAKKKSISSKIEKESSAINLSNIRFYIGLLNEYENLKIAYDSLARTILQQRSGEVTLDLVLQTISILSEAFNNVILPLKLEPSQDILSFRETLKYIRNKANEHPDLLQTIKHKDFMKAQIFKDSIATTIVNKIITQDFESIRKNTLNRLMILRKIIYAEERWEVLLSNIYNRFWEMNEKLEGGKGKRVTDPEKERTKWKSPEDLLKTDLWQDNGLPILEGLRRYYFHPTYSLESVLLNERTKLNLTANIVYGAELGWTIDHLKLINFKNLKSKIQELIFFLPILFKDISQFDKFQENLLSDYKQLYGNTDLSVRIEIQENLEGLDYSLSTTPLWAVAAFPKDIDDTKLKYQILYRLISGVYEQLDRLIERNGDNFFDGLQPRFRNLTRYLYQNLRIKRNFFAHDLWRVNDERFSKPSQACAENIAKQIISILWQALDKPENKIRNTKKPNQDGDLTFEVDFIKAVRDGNLNALKQRTLEFLCLNTSIVYFLEFGPQEKKNWSEFLVKHFANRNKAATSKLYNEFLSCILWYGRLYDRTLGINFIDKDGRTAIHYAAETGSPEMISYLYENGGFPDFKDDSGKDVIDILEERLANVEIKSTEREALQKILIKMRSEALLHGGEEYDEIYKKLKQRSILELKKVASTHFSLNMYDDSGNTLLNYLAGINDNDSKEIKQWLKEHGADSTIKPLICMDQPIYSDTQYKNGEIYFPREISNNPTLFYAHHERKLIPKTNFDSSFTLVANKSRKGLDVVPIRPGYYPDGIGFGSASSPYTGTEQGLINSLTNRVKNGIHDLFQELAKKVKINITTQEEFLKDYEIYKFLPWSPRWIAQFLVEMNHSLEITKLPYIACGSGQEFKFNGLVDSSSRSSTMLNKLFIDKAKHYLKMTVSIRDLIIKDIIDIFRNTKLPVGILYPREEELYIKPNSIEIGLPDSIIKNKEISALRSRISYLYFTINMLKKYIYLDNPHFPIFATTRDLVNHLKDRDEYFKDVALILQEYITDVDKLENIIKSYFKESLLYNDFVDYFLQENHWLNYSSTASATLKAIAQSSQTTVYIWRQTNEVSKKDLELQQKIDCENSSNNWHFLSSNNQTELIPLNLFTKDKNFEEAVDKIFKTSLFFNDPSTALKDYHPKEVLLNKGKGNKHSASTHINSMKPATQRSTPSFSPIIDKEHSDKIISVRARGIALRQIIIPGDGDCGYQALGLTRSEASNMLLSAINQEEIKKLIAPEIEDHFATLPEKMKNNDYQALEQKLAEADQSLRTAVDETRQGLINERHTVSSYTPDELFLYINQIQNPSDALLELKLKLHEALKLVDNIAKQKEIYCRKEETIKTYIEHFISVNPLDFETFNPGHALNYLNFSPVNENGQYRTSAGDALTHILGKNLIIVNPSGNIIHEYKKDEDMDTLYLIQASVNHYNRGEL